MDNRNIQRITVGQVKLHGDQSNFKALFSRFDQTSHHGWSEQKQKYCGAVGNVINYNNQNSTIEVIFDDR